MLRHLEGTPLRLADHTAVRWRGSQHEAADRNPTLPWEATTTEGAKSKIEKSEGDAANTEAAEESETAKRPQKWCVSVLGAAEVQHDEAYRQMIKHSAIGQTFGTARSQFGNAHLYTHVYTHVCSHVYTHVYAHVYKQATVWDATLWNTTIWDTEHYHAASLSDTSTERS